MPDVGYTRNEGTFMTFLDFSPVMERIRAEEKAATQGDDTAEEYFRDWLTHQSGVLSESRFHLRQRRRRPHANERGLVAPGAAGSVRGDGRSGSQRLEEAEMEHRYLAAVCAPAMIVALAAAPAAGQTLRTGWGDPDLQGIWDFRTITPLERPEDAGDKAFLTVEEVAAAERAAVERDRELWEAEAQRAEAGGNVGAYNNFWMDSERKAIETRRTSLIVHPPDGRFPELSAVGAARAAARRAHMQMHPADAYTDRNTSDRCLVGFNAGPADHAAGLQPEHAALPDPRTTR